MTRNKVRQTYDLVSDKVQGKTNTFDLDSDEEQVSKIIIISQIFSRIIQKKAKNVFWAATEYIIGFTNDSEWCRVPHNSAEY